MTIALGTVPGFSDLQATPLASGKPAIGAHLQRMNSNANFGLVRLEFFTGLYAHGDTVPLPTSDVDGYTYARSELTYIWVPQSTANQATGWASYREPWTMWYGIWNVDQNTGAVTSEIGYRGNDDHKERQATTNDGVLQVFTVAQRQKNNLVLKSQPAFTRKVDADFYVGEALHTGLMTALNSDAKFGVVNTEVIYMGVFAHGATVPQPVSPADGRTYAYSEVMFVTAWRWTGDTDGSGNPQKPAINKGQLQDWHASVTAGGGVTTEATVYELSGQHTYNTGRVAVFAFCQRPLGTTFLTQQTGFSEIVDSMFAPGSSLRAATMQQLNKNIGQSVCSPEFFGPTNYVNGNTIPVPTSPLDSYVYQRSELTYVWDWADTGPSANTTGRLSVVHGSISSTGVVTVNDYRLNSGASAVSLVHEGTMRVVVVGKRASNYGTPPAFVNRPPAFGSDDVVEFLGPNDRQTQYLSKVDGTVSLSTMLNPQGSMAPNQTITLTFTMPSSPNTLLLITWLQQSLLRVDNSTLVLNSSSGSNLSVNGDFEAAGTVGAQASGWSLVSGNALTKDNGSPHSGSFNGKINNAGGATSQNFSTATIALTGGQVYVLEGWVKVGTAMPNIPAHAGACIDLAISSGITSFTIYTKFGAFEGGSTTTPRMGWPADGATHAYGFFQCFFKPAASGTVNLNCIMQSNGGDAEFDDIKLYPFNGGLYSGLSNGGTYYVYPYISVASGQLLFANGNPPPTSPSDTFSQQAQFDGRIGVPPKKIIIPSAGGGGTSDTGGGDGTCPEFNEPVTIQRWSDTGVLLFEGTVPAKEVTTGYESDDGTIRTGCHILGWSFAQNRRVFRAVHRTRQVHCAGWVTVEGHRLTPCEPVWHSDSGEWLPAWKFPGSGHEQFVSIKMDIEVEADWDDEHNYYVGDLLIHNAMVLPC